MDTDGECLSALIKQMFWAHIVLTFTIRSPSDIMIWTLITESDICETREIEIIMPEWNNQNLNYLSTKGKFGNHLILKSASIYSVSPKGMNGKSPSKFSNIWLSWDFTWMKQKIVLLKQFILHNIFLAGCWIIYIREYLIHTFRKNLGLIL